MRVAPAICFATYCLCSACTGQQSGGLAGAGGPADSGSAVGGRAGDGTGGTIAFGGTSGAGGVASSGGTSGGVPDSAIGAGGTSGAGGTTNTGGSTRSDGGLGGARVEAGMGGRTGLDGGRSGNGGSGGGGNATGGITATGGLAGGKGGAAGSSDRCDVGVYDSASPPKVLSLTGSLGCHDPSAIAGDGTYYAFCTGLGAETSTNLTSWRSAGKPFAAPSWLTSTISGVGDLWAPDVSQFGGKYHLYYSGSTFGSNKSCIGHATSASMAGAAWTDDGAATICSNVGSKDDWNAIDPNVIVDTEGKPWLTLGSFWSGLKVIQLDDSGKRVGTTITSIANRPSSGGALEAPFMVRRCGYYYLFMSWDTCCKGADSTYNIRVVRGTSVIGPFTDKAGTAALQGGGTLIAQGDSSFAGPGGQSVMFTGNKAYLVYHAYAKPSGAITLRIAELAWDSNGWPVPVGP